MSLFPSTMKDWPQGITDAQNRKVLTGMNIQTLGPAPEGVRQMFVKDFSQIPKGAQVLGKPEEVYENITIPPQSFRMQDGSMVFGNIKEKTPGTRTPTSTIGTEPISNFERLSTLTDWLSPETRGLSALAAKGGGIGDDGVKQVVKSKEGAEGVGQTEPRSEVISEGIVPAGANLLKSVMSTIKGYHEPMWQQTKDDLRSYAQPYKEALFGKTRADVDEEIIRNPVSSTPLPMPEKKQPFKPFDTEGVRSRFNPPVESNKIPRNIKRSRLMTPPEYSGSIESILEYLQMLRDAKMF
jgi:hypothetical protein